MRFNLFDTIFILRPLILIVVWNFFLIGNYLATRSRVLNKDVILGLLIYTALMGGVYILNQITDIETDRLNKKLFLLSEGYIPLRFAIMEMVIIWFFALTIGARFGWIFMIFILLSLLLGVFYSLPPVKLKGRPILDTLSNAIGYGMLNFAVGWLSQRPFEWSMFIKFLPYFLSISAVFINTTIVDMEGDKKSGEITTAVFLGEKPAYLLSSVLMAVAVIVSLLMHDIICFIPSAIVLPLFLYLLLDYKKENPASRKLTILSFRLPGLIFTIITGYLYPPYLIFLFILIIGMKVYYKYRFGIVYPTLTQG